MPRQNKTISLETIQWNHVQNQKTKSYIMLNWVFTFFALTKSEAKAKSSKKLNVKENCNFYFIIQIRTQYIVIYNIFIFIYFDELSTVLHPRRTHILKSWQSMLAFIKCQACFLRGFYLYSVAPYTPEVS